MGIESGNIGRGQGTFAELAAVEEAWLYPTPDSVSDQIAAATSLVAITSYLGLARHARLACRRNAFHSRWHRRRRLDGRADGQDSRRESITTASSDTKLAICRELGADLAINYRARRCRSGAKNFAAGGVDVYWETYREPDFDRAVRMLAPRGG